MATLTTTTKYEDPKKPSSNWGGCGCLLLLAIGAVVLFKRPLLWLQVRLALRKLLELILLLFKALFTWLPD